MIREKGYKQKRMLRNKRDVRQILFYSTLFILFVIALTLKRCLGPAYHHGVYIPEQREKGDTTLNWTKAVRNYTLHAKCRMECRHIDDKKVLEVLTTGTINYPKSDLEEPDCQKRFAVEGYSQGQHIRVIATPCSDKLTIITCIDLDQHWPCDCGEENKKMHDEY